MTIVSSTVGIIVLYKKNVSGLLNIANSQILPTIFSELKKILAVITEVVKLFNNLFNV